MQEHICYVQAVWQLRRHSLCFEIHPHFFLLLCAGFLGCAVFVLVCAFSLAAAPQAANNVCPAAYSRSNILRDDLI